MLLLLLASWAAQDDPGQVWVHITGRVDLTYAFRDRRTNEASLWTPGGLPSGSPLRKSDDFVLPDVAVRLDIDASEVRAALEIGNLPLHFTSADPRLQHDRLGESPGVQVELLQAWVEPIPELRLGLQDFSWDPMGRGHPLFLAPSRSESPWGEQGDSTVPPFPASGTNTVPQTRRDRLRPAGFTARIDDLTIFGLQVAEGGSYRFDETAAGAIYERALGELRVGGVLAWFRGGGPDQQIWTAGLAASVASGPFFLGAEGYGQRGNGRTGGHAVRLIARWADGIRLQVTATRVSGDRRGDDRRDTRFYSYEDNDATLIVEGNEFGLDIDSNYQTVQVSVGYPMDAGGLLLQPLLTAAWFRFLEPVPLTPDPPAGVSGRSRSLGLEIDGSLEAALNVQLSVFVGVASLFRADALANFTALGDTHAWLVTAGVRLRF